MAEDAVKVSRVKETLTLIPMLSASTRRREIGLEGVRSTALLCVWTGARWLARRVCRCILLVCLRMRALELGGAPPQTAASGSERNASPTERGLAQLERREHWLLPSSSKHSLGML